MSITECLEESSIVCARNGGQMTDLHRRIDPYSVFRACKEKDAEILRLKTALNAANNKPRNNAGVTGNFRLRNTGGGRAGGIPPGNGYFGGRHGGGAQGSGAQRAGEGQDPAYAAMKRTTCKFYNERRGCDRQDTCQRLHKCSVKTGEGQACMADHPYHQHRMTN